MYKLSMYTIACIRIGVSTYTCERLYGAGLRGRGQAAPGL